MIQPPGGCSPGPWGLKSCRLGRARPQLVYASSYRLWWEGNFLTAVYIFRWKSVGRSVGRGRRLRYKYVQIRKEERNALLSRLLGPIIHAEKKVCTIFFKTLTQETFALRTKVLSLPRDDGFFVPRWQIGPCTRLIPLHGSIGGNE